MRMQTMLLTILLSLSLGLAYLPAHAWENCQDDSQLETAFQDGQRGPVVGLSGHSSFSGNLQLYGDGGESKDTTWEDIRQGGEDALLIIAVVRAVWDLLEWLFVHDSDCAGAIAGADSSLDAYIVWNHDSTESALEGVIDYCQEESGGSCRELTYFRYCAAMARSGKMWFVARGKTVGETEDRAMSLCKMRGGKSCYLSLEAKCNSG